MLLPTPLRTPRLLLRSLGPEDATQTYVSWLSDPDVMRYLESRWSAHTVESVRAFIDTCNASAADLLLGVCLPGGRHIGNIKIGPMHPQHRSAAIGLMFGARDCWGQGYASEAIGAVTAYAFAALGLEKVWAGCYASNEASQRAFLRNGFVVEGRQKHMWLFEGRREDNVVLGLCRADWSGASAK